MDLSMGLIRADILMAKQGIELQFVVRIDTLEKYQKIADEWFDELKAHGIR